MSPTTAQLSTAIADRYRIERELGQGGMATVYLAHDLKHDRKVALKVLKPELAAVLGAERFVVEIRTTAALQHPHILPLFDSGTAEGFLFYVMPFIDGETLRDRLDRDTQLGVDEAIRITCEIADALHYAHTRGVIHRDIKPENILMQGGRPMVADFGIALAVSAAAGGRMTETGLSLGTPHYMSPEQATAEKEITARSDVYSLASMLYEMLTGNPPHTGASAQQIIMKIITETPVSVLAARRTVPPHVADAIAQALEKLPADRFASAADFARALQHDDGTRRRSSAQRASAPTDRRTTPWRTIALGTGVAALLFGAVAAWSLARTGASRDASAPVAFAYRPMLEGVERPTVSITRDGWRIAQSVVDSNGVAQVSVRALGSTQQSLLAGAEGCVDPVFSPDGQWLLCLLRGTLMRVPAGGGVATVLASDVNGVPAIGDDGTVYFARMSAGLWRVPLTGGEPEQVTVLDTTRRELTHWTPQVLPGGKAVLFNSYGTPIANSFIEVVELKTGTRTVLVRGAVQARYVPSGHLLYVRDGAIFATTFDPATFAIGGTAVPVIEKVAWSLTDGFAAYDVADNGTLVYVDRGEWDVDKRVVWVDRSGREETAISEPGDWAEPRLSPDGRWIAAARVQGNRQLWLYDRTRRVLSEFTRGDGISFAAVWTPDSRALIYSREVPVYDLYRQRLDGSAPEPLVSTRYDKHPSGLSPDGARLLYTESAAQDHLLLAHLDSGTTAPLDASGAERRNGVVSPDGRWIAYEEVAPGRQPDVWVRPLSGPGDRTVVSAGGGDQPRFTRGGREIVYRRGVSLFTAAFDPATGEVGAPVELFRKRTVGRLASERTAGYDVTPDGSRFLMVVADPRPEALPNVVITNWFEELRRRVPR